MESLFERPAPGNRALLAHLRLGGPSRPSREEDDLRLAEFGELVTSASLVCAGTVVGSRDRPHPRWFVGAGKADELQEALAASDADLVIFNHELTAIQQRNLETRLETRVMTRTELILHIFADRARTGEGQLQVELAQLTHAQTRLIRGWTHLDRQKGGVNLRGAGETQLEMDQRMLAGRVRYVRDRLERVHRQRAQSRRRRNRARIPTVALAGYTNAGKSTLFNALTADGVHAADQMFATLDPTMRRWQVGPGAEVVLADTVGFIRELPVTLVDAFKATLEEIAEADLILHVIDAASPDAGLAEEVRRVLAEIGAADTPTIEVFNKVDLLEGGAHCLGGVTVSAIEGTGVEALRDTVAGRLGLDARAVTVHLGPEAGKVRSWLYDHGAVEDETIDDDGTATLHVRLDAAHVGELRQLAPEAMAH